MIKNTLNIYITLTGQNAINAQVYKDISKLSHPAIYMASVNKGLKEVPQDLIDKVKKIVGI